jgi:hypothetical protein
MKHITVLVFVILSLILVCASRSNDDGPVVAQTCSDASCPFPRKDAAITVLAKLTEITEIARENWQLDLPGEGWEVEGSSQPEMKVVRLNSSKECMIVLIKEPTDTSFGQYVIESIEAFNARGAQITIIKQVTLNQQKFVLLEGNVFSSDAFMAWNSIKDGFGYSFICFYHPNVDAGSAQHDLCIEIANSLQIK